MSLRARAALLASLAGSDVLLIVPPFGAADRPSLAAHLLQACVRRHGFELRVLYANLLLVAELGWERYAHVCEGKLWPGRALPGERVFAASAHGMPSMENDAADGAGSVEAVAAAWVETTAELVAGLSIPVVACTSTFEQTNASLALLRRVKQRQPGVVTAIGGANCEAGMAVGIASLDPGREVFDYVFSGESEVTFPAFLASLFAGSPPPARIVEGAPCRDLDALPPVDYAEYFAQRAWLLDGVAEVPDAASAVLPFETSRGCWWGQKHHCTFCGLNATGMRFRSRSAAGVVAELARLAREHPGRCVAMTDNIMPHDYFRSLLPALAAADLPLRIFYEQKSNLTLAQVVALKQAGVVSIQPGIESLSTELLALMDKGVSARQNIALLRFARLAGVDLIWNLLWGLPGDQAAWYRRVIDVVPYLEHLQPPSGLVPLSIDRFSPYFEAPEDHGIRELAPLPAYAQVFPATADLAKLAYFFVGRYESGSWDALDTVRALERAVGSWRTRWAGGAAEAPALHVRAITSVLGEHYLLFDTRACSGAVQPQPIDAARAAAALTAQRYVDNEAQRWALDHRAALVLDGAWVPLATAAPELVGKLAARTPITGPSPARVERGPSPASGAGGRGPRSRSRP